MRREDAQVDLQAALQPNAGFRRAFGDDGLRARKGHEGGDHRVGVGRGAHDVDVADGRLVAAQTPGREQILRLTLTSLSGKKARTCYDKNNQVDPSVPANRARLLFSLAMSNAVPGFTDKLGKAVKKLVALAGGSAEKELF